MYKLFTITTTALVLVACGTEEQGLTFEMAETSAEYAYCFDYNGTEVCFDGPVECFPRDGHALDCFVAEPAELPSDLKPDVPGLITDSLEDVNVPDPNRLDVDRTRMPMELDDNVADLITDDFDNIEGLDVNEPDPVITADFEERSCEMCKACNGQCQACWLCIEASKFAEVVESGDVDEDLDAAWPHVDKDPR